jgi:hypothetical protein
MCPAARIALAVLLLGCAQPIDNKCPVGTRPIVDTDDSIPRRRFCERPDGTKHGPEVLVDRNERERRVGQWVDGKKHGRWLEGLLGDHVAGERVYVHGDVVRSTLRSLDGVVIVSEWKDGLAHGRYTKWNENGDKTFEGFYARGRRSSTWRWFGQRRESRTYDDGGFLRAIDGKPVQPPPDRIEVAAGITVEYASCGLVRIGPAPSSSCLDLFEAFQLCASREVDASKCREQAISIYRVGLE